MKRNLTLKKLGYSSFNEYLGSDHWRAVNVAYRKAGRPSNCFVCNGKGTRLYHKTYKNLGREPLDDLVMTCDGCHEQIHRLVADRPSVPLALAPVALKRIRLKEIPKRGEVAAHCRECDKIHCVHKHRFVAELDVMKGMGRPWSCKECRRRVLGIPDVLVRKVGGFYRCVLKPKTVGKFSLTKTTPSDDKLLYEEKIS